MTIKQTTGPYEILARWDETGEYKGGHFKEITVTFDDVTNGKLAPDQIGNASPQILVKMKAVFGQAVIDGAKKIDTLNQEKDDAIFERDNLTEEKRSLIAVNGSLTIKLEAEKQQKDNLIIDKDNLDQAYQNLINANKTLASEHEDLKRKYLVLEAKVNGD